MCVPWIFSRVHINVFSFCPCSAIYLLFGDINLFVGNERKGKKICCLNNTKHDLSYPTENFSILDPQNPSSGVSELHKICGSPNIEALNVQSRSRVWGRWRSNRSCCETDGPTARRTVQSPPKDIFALFQGKELLRLSCPADKEKEKKKSFSKLLEVLPRKKKKKAIICIFNGPRW